MNEKRAIGRVDLRFPGGKAKAFTLSYDDGVEQDLHLIELLRQYDLKATFNLSSGLYAPEGTRYPQGTIHRRMTRKACLAAYSDPHCEVALHGLTHPFLETLPPADLCYEVVADRRNLEADFGRIIRGMAYPYGTYNQQVIEALKAAGIAYSRTTVSTHAFGLPGDWRQWHPTCHHTEEIMPELTEKFLAEQPQRAPMLYYVWGHDYEFERDGNWEVMEKLCAEVSGREDVWYATNLEIHDYAEAYSRLEWSADGSVVFNPSAAPVFCCVNGETRSIAGGAAVSL